MQPLRWTINATVATCLLGATASTANATTATQTATNAALPEWTSLGSGEARSITAADGQTVRFRAFEGIAYAAQPVEPQHQRMNVYVPEAYFAKDGAQVGAFNVSTAPIFLPNHVGGYMPALPGVPGQSGRMGRAQQPADGLVKMDAMLMALSRGYVVASPGARGRTQAAGKAPAAIVDLKAAVRWLHANDAAMPGDARKIISNGTSAGGALSVLLGASGHAQDFEDALRTIGAAQASDAIFAVSAYCPISILDKADAAYEWQFQGVHDYQKISIESLDYNVKRQTTAGTLDKRQKQLSAELALQFAPYVRSLNLKPQNPIWDKLKISGTIDSDNLRDYLSVLIQQSAQNALQKDKTLASIPWLHIENGQVKGVNFALYAQTVGRQKTPPAFDAVDLSSGENQLFGSKTIDKRHFTDYSFQNSSVENAQKADAETVRLMNPMHFIHAATPTAHWRIRVGTHDRDTSLAISALLANKLENAGKSVDYYLPWAQGHGGDYDLSELFEWMDRITHPHIQPQ